MGEENLYILFFLFRTLVFSFFLLYSIHKSHHSIYFKGFDQPQDSKDALHRAHQVSTLPHIQHPCACITAFTVAAEANSNVSTAARRWWPLSTANLVFIASSTATKASSMTLPRSESLHMNKPKIHVLTTSSGTPLRNPATQSKLTPSTSPRIRRPKISCLFTSSLPRSSSRMARRSSVLKR